MTSVWRVAVCSLVLLVVCASAFTCSSNLDCHLNGVCSGGTCQCDSIWTEADCSRVAFKPNAIEYLHNGYGQSATANTSTWGGNVLRDDDGLYHLFVSEMVDGCSLTQWHTNSQISHAVSKTPSGPYTFRDVAVPVWAHNPQVVEWTNSTGHKTYILFHIGGGVPTGKGPTQCSSPWVWPSPRLVEEDDKPVSSPKELGTGSTVHTATSLDGPWTPASSQLPGCNNPSPLQLRNGTWLLACNSNQIYRSDGPLGPYVLVSHTPHAPNEPEHIRYEDPFLFEDPRGGIHVFFHVYNNTMPCGDCVGTLVTAHDFSPDGVTWYASKQEPYDNTYTTTSGAKISVSTRERPKLLYNAEGVPTHLINGVSAVPSCAPLYPSRCKMVQPGAWTMTLFAPLATA